jgi:hypothetical protein
MTSERLYRILLKAYPRGYRPKFEEAMAQCFRDQLRTANTAGKRVRLWFRTIADFTLTLPARHLERGLRRLRGGIPDGYTKNARFAIYFAGFEASSFSRGETGLEHLLLGILREDQKLAVALLGSTGIKEIVRAIETQEANPRHRPSRKELLGIPLSQECKMALAQALEEARGSGLKLNPRHLLRAILHQDTSLAARVLRARGLDMSKL